MIADWLIMTDFLTTPLPAQFFAAFTLLFFFFWIAIEVKLFSARLIKKGGVYKVIGYALLYTVGPAFLLADAGMNIIYMPMLYCERANKHGEGWLVTSRLKYHKRQPGMYWQKKVSLFICDKFVEKVEPEHCS